MAQKVRVNRRVLRGLILSTQLTLHIVYKTEGELGTAIKESGVPREKLFVTTKAAMTGNQDLQGAIKTSLSKLQLDYVDLYVRPLG